MKRGGGRKMRSDVKIEREREREIRSLKGGK